LRDFLSQISINELEEDSAEESGNRATLSTLHGAKGLEFPLVIFPFAKTDQFRLTKKFLWLNIENEDISGLPFAMISPIGL